MEQKINDLFSVDFSQCLGRGAYSKVYVGFCQDKRIIKENLIGKVAIKHITRKEMTERLQERLLQEIEIMKYLEMNPHPNIVKCYGIVDDGDDVYLIMEYCDSGDLSSLLRKPIKEKYVQFYMCQLNQGLQFLDQAKIFHRDIKPKNILLTKNRKILKIADFGFAKMAQEEASLTQTLCGSPLYMAPEIMKKKVSTKKTDLWSIGMIMYEMLFGLHPFKDTENLFDLMYAVETREIQIPPEKNNNTQLSSDCLYLLKRLLQKNERYRLDWDEFYHNRWLNKYIIQYDENYKVKQTEYKHDKNNGHEPNISDSLVQSINASLETTSTLCQEQIKIITDYHPETDQSKQKSTFSSPIPIHGKASSLRPQ